METYRNRIAIKTLLIQLFALVFFSCSSSVENDNIEEQVAKQMEHYIYNQYEDSYDYRAIETIYEYTDSLCWEKDLYQIQNRFYYAQYRRTEVTNSYIDPEETYKNNSLYSLYGSHMLFNLSSIFEYPFIDAQKGLNKCLQESYITKEEKEVCDYFYFSETVPFFRKEIEGLENQNFKGWRIYHRCQFRIASGEIIQKQYVLYHNKDLEWSCFGINPYELKYNYPMFRDYIKNVLSVDLESEEIRNLKKKYSLQNTNILWNYSSNKLQEIYHNAISRLSIN